MTDTNHMEGLSPEYLLALTQEKKYHDEVKAHVLEDYYFTPELKVNKYQLNVVEEVFPELTTFEHIALLKTNIQSLDKYGVAFSLPKTYSIVKTINSLKSTYPTLCYNSKWIHPDYLRSAMTFITILHNIHKVSSNKIFTSNLNSKYRRLLKDYEGEPVGTSIVNMEDEDFLHIADTVFQISLQHGKALTEDQLLALLIRLADNHELDTLFNIFTTCHLSYFPQILELPDIYAKALTIK